MDNPDIAPNPPNTIRLHFTKEEGGGLFDVYIPSINFEKITPGHANGKDFTILKLDIGHSEYCVRESVEEIKQLIQQARSRQTDET
jgi:hypothetical protein